MLSLFQKPKADASAEADDAHACTASHAPSNKGGEKHEHLRDSPENSLSDDPSASGTIGEHEAR